MKILTAEQQQELDKRTMENEPISSIDLMERAATCCTDAIFKHLDKNQTIGVLCGPGNNGGDGLVISRFLDSLQFSVTCYYVALSEKGSDEFEKNRLRLKSTSVEWIELKNDTLINETAFNEDVYIDAIFGTGLSRPAEGLAKTVIEKINRLDKEVFAVDVPSGMYCDSPNDKRDIILKASRTFTFHAPKLAFFYPEQGIYCGEFEVLDIGLDEKATSDQKSRYRMITLDQLKGLRKVRSRFSHKGTFGHANIVAGSRSKMGAALLTAEGVLKVGAGLVTANIPNSGSSAFNVRIPSVMLNYTGENECEKVEMSDSQTYGVGPGLGTTSKVKNAFGQFIEEVNNPIVIDADGLNILAENDKLMQKIPKKSILTPHPKEFERLAGHFKNSYERTERQLELSKSYGIYVVLKDAFTVISTPKGEVFINPFGSPGMSTGGSGDVLTGMITGLLAQGYNPENAAIFGVGLHGLSGEEAAKQKGAESMSSEDLADHITSGYRRLEE